MIKQNLGQLKLSIFRLLFLHCIYWEETAFGKKEVEFGLVTVAGASGNIMVRNWAFGACSGKAYIIEHNYLADEKCQLSLGHDGST